MTTLLLGGRVHSPADPAATALAVVDGAIAFVGADGPARALFPDADVIDLAGAFVAPAFVDAHVHATSAGLLTGGLDLTGCPDLTACLDLVARHAAARPGAVLWGHGWDEERWPDARPPTRAELDRAAGGAPVYLSRIDVHSAAVSSALLERAPEAVGSAGWSPDGPLAREAHHAVRRAARESITPGQRRDAQRAFLADAAAHGVAIVHECAGPDVSSAEDLADLLAGDDEHGAADSAADGAVEVVGYWGQAVRTADEARDLLAATGAHGLAGDLFCDGALGSRTAALREPYADAPVTRGAAYLDAGEVAAHVAACTAAGVQAGFHVIGDAATDAVVAGFDAVADRLGAPALAARTHRLEHLEMVTPEQAERLAAWGVAASVQPVFDAEWGGPDRMYATRLGADRAAGMNPFALLARAGVPVALGSDAPVTPLGPWAAVRAAVHHRTPGAGLSPRAAFTAHTRAGHRAAGGTDPSAGTLVPGAPASYAVWAADELVVAAASDRVQRWSTDPRSRVPGLPPLHPGADLPRCLRTVHRGRVLFDAPGALS